MVRLRSNGGMLCTVFSSIFISRLVLSLKDEEEGRRESSSGMIPLSSVRFSGAGSDYKDGRGSTLSGTTAVDMPDLEKGRTTKFSTHSTSISDGHTSNLSNASKDRQWRAPIITSRKASIEEPNDYPQWIDMPTKSESPVHVIRLAAAPPGIQAKNVKSTRSSSSNSIISHVDFEERVHKDALQSSFSDSPDPFMDQTPDDWTLGRHGSPLVSSRSDIGRRSLGSISEESPTMQRASQINPFICDPVPPNTACSQELSPQETTWLGRRVSMSLTEGSAVMQRTSVQSAPKTPTSPEIFLTAPTTAATPSPRKSFAVTRVPAPSPVSIMSTMPRHASHQTSWIAAVQTKLLEVKV